jgi:hypothetical protein
MVTEGEALATHGGRRSTCGSATRRAGECGRLVPMLVTTLAIDADTFHRGTGWEIKPEGACKGEICVPLPGGFDLASTAERLGMAVVHDEGAGLWAIGPESLGGRALTSAAAPELVLDDLDGAEFRLSSLRGKKVVLVAWAPD